MDRRKDDATSVTLLAKLRDDPTDQAVWQEFVRRYRPLIHGFCLSRHLQPADAEDVTQAVLTRLINKMRDFRYDPAQSFRGWLKTVTRRVLANELAKRRRERRRQRWSRRRDARERRRSRRTGPGRRGGL